MILFLLQFHTHLLNVLRYASLRATGAFFTSFLLSFILIPFLIKRLQVLKGASFKPRAYTPSNHQKKTGTPSLGGLSILTSLVLTTLIWGNIHNAYLWLFLTTALAFGAVGFTDDYLKIRKGNSDGLPAIAKFGLQLALGIGATLWLVALLPPWIATSVGFPFFKSAFFPLGFFFIFYGAFVLTATSNAVNLTDGLDGLAAVPIITTAFVFGIITYLSANLIYAFYLHIPYLPGAGEGALVAASICGACFSFLWYNAPPAKIFMGDTGSLSLGALLGLLTLLSKQSPLFLLVGGIFILEVISVVLQLASRRFFHRRIFAMAPLHHHFEKKGAEETRIVVRFWIISILLALMSLITLKIR